MPRPLPIIGSQGVRHAVRDYEQHERPAGGRVRRKTIDSIRAYRTSHS